MRVFLRGCRLYYLVLILLLGLSQLFLLNQISTLLEMALIRVLYGLFLTLVIISCSIGSARFLFQRLNINQELSWLDMIFIIPMGMGIFAYQVFFLGIIGALNTIPVVVLMGINLIISYFTCPALNHPRPFEKISRFWTVTAKSSGYRLYAAVAVGIIVTAFVFALTPPWSPDALSYHLEGPKLFLENRGVYLLPNVWGANSPFTIEMLYLVGLALQTEVTSKLIHLSYTVLLVMAVIIFSRRYLTSEIGLVSSIVFVAFPIFPVWASIAYADMAWALYDFLSLFALINYFQKQEKNWLIISGMMMGFAMGSKYLALGGFAVAGLLVIWENIKFGLRKTIRDIVFFGSVSGLIAAPWYLKNWILAGNPLFPFFWGGPGWNQNRLDWFMNYLHSFGLGKGLEAILKIPADIYLNHTRYSTFMGSIEILSVLFPIVVLIVFIKRTKEINILLVTSILFFAVWIWGSQQIRFLLPIIPRLSLMTGYVLISLDDILNSQRAGKIIVQGLLGGVLFATVFYSLIFWSMLKPLPVITGRENQNSFLRRNVSNYQALEYVKTELPDQSKVMMLWDSEGYYCGDKCWVDSDHSRWSRMVIDKNRPEEIAAGLRDQGVTHLMINQGYASFVTGIDDTGLHLEALVYLKEQFAPRCLEARYQDENAAVWELVCP